MSKRVLNDYFKRAKTWADDNFGRLEQSRNRYQAAFLAAMALNAVALIVIGMLAHYQTLVPLLVHHYDNGVTTVEPIENAHIPKNQAQVDSDIVRYIQFREAYEVSSYRVQYELVHLLSSNLVAKEYVKEQEVANPASLIRTLGNQMKREVRVYHVNFLDSLLANEKEFHKDHRPLAEVDFSLTDTDRVSGKSTLTHYNVLISWQYTGVPTSPEIRWKNWAGFEVVRYSKQPRAVETHA